VAGIHLFGAHDPKNFGSLPAAFLSLFRLVTLDNWTDLFSAQISRVAGPVVAIYFVTFIVFGTMIILNLFIGIIMNSMSEMHAEMEARDRARHEKAFGHATLADEFNTLEQQLDALKEQAARLKSRLGRRTDGPNMFL
jgi:voltage-gated sodium channel